MITAEFAGWIKRHKIQCRNVEAAYVAEGWRGVVSTGCVEAEDVLIEVPEKVLMSHRTALLDKEVAQKLIDSNLTHTEILAIHLLREVSKGPQSFWAPYLAHLPPKFGGYTNLTYFGEEDAKTFQNEKAVWAMEAAKQRSERSWRRCKQILQNLGVGEDWETYKAFRWAEATISSRTMHVPWSDAGALVPYADFFNYRPPPPPATPHFTDVDDNADSGAREPAVCGDGAFHEPSQCYRIHSHLSYAPGEQVFLCYGKHTNLELLEHYGFLLEDNPNDKVFLSAAAVASVTSAPPPSEECYLHANGAPSWELMKALRLAVLSQQQRRSLSYLAAGGQACTPEAELQAIGRLKLLCQDQLSAFLTSVEEDVNILTATDSGQYSDFHILALQWRVSQKRILGRAIAAAERIIN